MTRPNIVFTEQEVPLQVQVHLYVPDSDMPVEIEGRPAVFWALMSGVPVRKKLHLLPEDIQVGNGYCLAYGRDGFKEGLTFSPAEVYSPRDAPVNKDYLPFVGGKRLVANESQPHASQVAKVDDNAFYYSCGFPFQPFSNNTAFNWMVDEYNNRPAEQLSKRLEYIERRLSLSKANPKFTHGVSRWKAEREFVLEALGRRYREKPYSELVRLFSQVGNEYLVLCNLPSDAELVPLHSSTEK